MSNWHPDHSLLLGFRFGLLDLAEHDQVAEHLSVCPTCRKKDQTTRKNEMTLHQTLASATCLPWHKRFYQTAAAPIGGMILACGATFLPSFDEQLLPLIFLFAGVLWVVVWLHREISRANVAFRHAEKESKVQKRSPAKTAFELGVALSVRHNLDLLRRRITTVALCGLGLAACSSFVLMGARLWEPELTATVVSTRIPTLAATLAIGTLLTGSLWAALRVVQLARQVTPWLKELMA